MTPSSADAHPLASLFQPRSLALIGATERSFWSNAAYGNLKRFGQAERCHLVNRNGGEVYGRPAARSCREIGSPIDLALVLVPARAVPDVIDDLAAAGARAAVLLSAGFAEAGGEGVQRQEEVLRRARAAGLRLLGPNCLGFIDYTSSMPVWTTIRRRQSEPGAVAIVSQSGAVAGYLADFAFRQGILLSALVSTGNEMDVDVADVVDWLATDSGTRSIAVFLEGVRNAKTFAAAAERACNAGKAVVVLKVGSSEASAAAARAHTGALVGDDRVFDAACRQLGLVRVDSAESLVTTADVIARLGRVEREGLAIASVSGGMCELAADLAEAHGIALATLTPQTRERLQGLGEFSGAASNPLDFTGAAMLDPRIFENGLKVLGADPNVGLVTCLFDAPEVEQGSEFLSESLDAIGRGLASFDAPSIVFSNTPTTITPFTRAREKASGLSYSGAGLRGGMEAIAATLAWSARCRVLRARAPAVPRTTVSTARPVGEQAALDDLVRHGVPVVPRVRVESAAEALARATELGSRVAMKVDAPALEHKTEAGGVVLNLAAEAVGPAYDAMMAAVRQARPDIELRGAVLSPMRTGGIELFVGTLRDPTWGPVLALGFGGIFVEVLEDTALRLLPITREDVLEMLQELRGRKLLSGVRGMPPADVERIADVVVRIGDAALDLGPELETLEVNPLRVDGSQVEALDALAVWRTHSAPHS